MVSPKPDKPATKRPPRADHDLQRIEADYSAGLLSNREIGKIHGVSHTMIQNWAKERGWFRDL